MLSRVAENLYWMSRYLERAEHTARLLTVKLESMLDQSPEDGEASWRRAVDALFGAEFAPTSPDVASLTQTLGFDLDNPSSLISSLRGARDNARQVREQISTEMWSHLNQMYLQLAPVNLKTSWSDQPAHIFCETLDNLHMFEGIAFSTMRHGEGWHFIQLGRYIERAQLISFLLDLHFGADARARPPAKYPDWLGLLRSCTAFEAYCKVYTANIQPNRVAEFLLFDAEFPHSIRFAVERMDEALTRVAPGAPPHRRAECNRLAGRLRANVDFGQIDELMAGTIDGFLAGVTRQCEQINDAVYAAYIEYDAETVV